MSYPEDELPHVTKETITCEKCDHVNIVKIKNVDKIKKRDHMLYTDDHTWAVFKAEAAAFNQPLGDFLRFILKQYTDRKEDFNVPQVEVRGDV